MLIVVDALDESKTDVKSEFLELISEEFPELPEWIKIFITSRPELQVRNKLQHLNPVEILPDDHHHKLDLEHFILHCLPNLNKDNVSSFISKCEGSFLYAYYLVNELKEMDLGIEPNLSDYVPKGISGFYDKQFKRLKTSLHSFNPGTWSSILKSFVNVIAASREPLPMKILFACMGVSSEEFEIREAIIGIMSEILPVYEDCLTVYHKSLWDWLTLAGYKEHAFVADVADGNERLWCACKSIYRDIDSLSSVSDFQISPDNRYTLKNGGYYLLDVGNAEDFQWLVNIRLNLLKLKFHGNLGVDIFRVLRFCESKRPVQHYWGKIHLCLFSNIFREYTTQGNKSEICYIYLQFLANGLFHLVQKSIYCKNEARDIFDTTNEIWMEEMGNEYNSNFKIISHAINGIDEAYFKQHHAMALSPDNKLLAYKDKRTTVEVFKLPSLILVFDLEIKSSSRPSLFLIFSPDSSYLLWNSVRSCISLREQKEVQFIPHGPESIDCCSFSSCGMKLVTSEKTLIKVWDVKNKNILVEVRTEIDVEYCMFSNCNSYILARPVTQIKAFDFNDIAILASTTLERIDIDKTSCQYPCSSYEDCYQIFSPPYWNLFRSNAKFEIRHFHLPTGGIALIANRYCSKPFTWKDRKCVIFFTSNFSPLVVYDFINQESVEFSCSVLTKTFVNSISKLDETFFVWLSDDQVFVLSSETPKDFSVGLFANHSDNKCYKSYALSPDNLYVACCDKNRILTIKSVQSGKTLQTAVLKGPPEACWWSKLYLWVVCKGVVVKYPYDSTHTKVLGNELEECAINFHGVLKFAEGVLVIRFSDNKGISVLKICKKKLYPQQIPDSNFTASSVAVSSDGCAVLLYRKSSSDYQLWEMASENRWELRTTGRLDDSNQVDWFCLTGTENPRSSIWLTYSNWNKRLCISTIDFPSGRKGFWHQLSLQHTVKAVIYVDSNILIIYTGAWIYFVKVSDGKIINSLYVDLFPDFRNVSSFYLASRGILLLAGKSDIKFFKIHNIESHLPSLTKE